MKRAISNTFSHSYANIMSFALKLDYKKLKMIKKCDKM